MRPCCGTLKLSVKCYNAGQKFAAGLFEDVGVPSASALDSASARELARQAAIEGLVLLQNSIVPASGQRLLPLGKPPALTKIAVLGLLGGCPNHTTHGPFVWCVAKQAQIVRDPVQSCSHHRCFRI